jgi:hypothetical protein
MTQALEHPTSAGCARDLLYFRLDVNATRSTTFLAGPRAAYGKKLNDTSLCLDYLKNSLLACREHGTINRVTSCRLIVSKTFDAETKNSAEAS